MILSSAIVTTWFAGICLYFIRKKLPFLINAIIYFFTVICLTNYTTILSLNLHLIKTTGNPIFFIVFLLYREFIMPFIIIIFVNYFIQAHWVSKLISLLSGLAIIEVVDVLLIKAKIISYTHWSLSFELLFNLLFLYLGVAMAKILIVLNKKEA